MDFMREAINEAEIGVLKKHGGPFGAVIVKDNTIIAKAHSMVLKSHDPTAHAEVEAIRAAAKKFKTHDLSACELYATSQPCPMCIGAIQWARITKTYYGCTYDDAAVIGFADKAFSKQPPSMTQMQQDECLKPMDLFKKRNGKTY